jgi:hypothetical protein
MTGWGTTKRHDGKGTRLPIVFCADGAPCHEARRSRRPRTAKFGWLGYVSFCPSSRATVCLGTTIQGNCLSHIISDSNLAEPALASGSGVGIVSACGKRLPVSHPFRLHLEEHHNHPASADT